MTHAATLILSRQTIASPQRASVLSRPFVRLFAVAVVIAHLLDLFTTYVLLASGASEMNPFSAGVIHAYGMQGLVVEKAAIIVITLYNMNRMGRRTAALTGIGATLITMAAVVWNLQVA